MRNDLRVLLTLLVMMIPIGYLFGMEEEVPEGFERILERGRIASIDDPEFVSAAEAEISDDSWVLGVVIDGQARAYGLNLLNHHEVVNDSVAGKPVAAVW